LIYTEQGNFCSKLIFWELSTPILRKKYPPLWTLKQKEHKGLKSAYQVYMSCVDETEAAIKLTGNMKNWRDLMNSPWFMDGDTVHSHEGLVVWREDMKARDASLAKKILIENTENGNVAAAKSLLNESKKKTILKKNKNNSKSSATLTRIEDFKRKNK
jgi:hypothetical protein